MKTKAKLTLAISVLSAVVLTAGVTSTFAWFTTRATASVSSTLTINGPSGLDVSVQRVLPTGTVTPLVDDEKAATPAPSVTTSSDIVLGAVSSYEGRYFVAPKTLKTNEGEDVYAISDFALADADWAHGAANPYVGYLKYNVVVSADEDSASQDLTLTVTINDDTDQKYGRVSIYEVTQANGRKAADKPELPNGTDKIEPSSGGYAGVFKEGVTVAGTETRMKYGSPITKEDAAPIGALPNASVIAEDFTSTSAKAYKYYVVAIWMEGCAAPNQNGLAGKTISVNLEFKLKA